MDTLSSQSRQSRQRQILGKDLDTTQSASWEESEHFQIASRTQLKIVWWILISTKQKLHLKNGTPEGSSCANLQKMSSFHCSKSRKCPAWSTQTLTMNTSHSTWCTKNGEKSKKYPYASPKVPPLPPPTTYSTSLNITSPPQPLKQSKKITDD